MRTSGARACSRWPPASRKAASSAHGPDVWHKSKSWRFQSFSTLTACSSSSMLRLRSCRSRRRSRDFPSAPAARPPSVFTAKGCSRSSTIRGHRLRLALLLYEGSHSPEALELPKDDARFGPVVWRGHLFDLLGRRAEAVAAYQSALPDAGRPDCAPRPVANGDRQKMGGGAVEDALRAEALVRLLRVSMMATECPATASPGADRTSRRRSPPPSRPDRRSTDRLKPALGVRIRPSSLISMKPRGRPAAFPSGSTVVSETGVPR
jgi:hypothetical protein